MDRIDVRHPLLASPGDAPLLGAFVRRYAGRLAVGVLLLVLTQAIERAIPWMLRLALDAMTAGHAAEVRTGALAVIGLGAVGWAIRTLSRIQVFDVGRDVEYDLRNALLEHLHRLGPAFFRTMPTGEIMSRATHDLQQVRLMVGFGGLHIVNSALAFGSAIALMLVVSPRLTLLALIPYPLIALSAAGFSRALYRRSVEAQAALGRLSDQVQEDVAGARKTRCR